MKSHPSISGVRVTWSLFNFSESGQATAQRDTQPRYRPILSKVDPNPLIAYSLMFYQVLGPMRW